jgi:hypothetical protein
MSYDPNRTADIYAEVESAPAKEKQTPPTSSNQERIDAARKRHIALTKETSAASGFGQHHANYFKDFSGAETSFYDFSHVTFLLNFLQEPTFQGLWFRLDDGRYDAIAANWKLVRATPMKFAAGVAVPPASASLAELKIALAARIKELKIDEVKLAEWMSVAHGIEGGRAFDRLPFTEKMSQFKTESE